MNHYLMSIKNKYDLIFDVGTLEHCFNVGQAFKNIMEMTKLGGTIFMATASKINHGFWNFCVLLHTQIFFIKMVGRLQT